MCLSPGSWEGWRDEDEEVCIVGDTSSGSRNKMEDAGGGSTIYILLETVLLGAQCLSSGIKDL